jgi:outer membrane receptor protein involved in Fe transport
VNGNWRPQGWLALRGNAGLDYTNRYGHAALPPSECPSATDRQGFTIDNRTNFFLYTVDGAGTATRAGATGWSRRPRWGVQFYRNIFDRNGASGTQLPPGATTVTAGASGGATSRHESRTLGGYLEQRVAFNDRLFLTAALRSDRNSAFGADFDRVFYPKLSASWVLSDEPFFPTPGFLTKFRLRAAYGASGVQPGTIDAVAFFSPTQVLGESGEVPGLVLTALGNTDLKPERSTELELGVEGSLWDGRVTADLTYYDKISRDALIERVLPPSVGTGNTVRFENLGEVRNWGWEALVNTRIVQSRNFGWDVTFNGTTNSNELVSLGGLNSIIISSTLRNVEGYPLNGWWSRRLVSYGDKDNDGIIEYAADQATSEITVSDSVEFHGYSSPRRELAVTNGFDLGRNLRLSGMIDYKGGHLVYNNTDRIRCASRNNCRGLVDRGASEYEQARTVAVRQHPSRTVAGFLEEGDFVRLRELALNFNVPQRWTASFLRTRDVTATLAGRNLGILWTKYTGVDPEAFGTTGDAPSSFQAFAPPTYFTFRLTLGL